MPLPENPFTFVTEQRERELAAQNKPMSFTDLPAIEPLIQMLTFREQQYNPDEPTRTPTTVGNPRYPQASRGEISPQFQDERDQIRGALAQAISEPTPTPARVITGEEIQRAIAQNKPIDIRMGRDDQVVNSRLGSSPGGSFSKVAYRGMRTSSDSIVEQMNLSDRVDTLRRRASDGMYRTDAADQIYAQSSAELPEAITRLKDSSVDKAGAMAQILATQEERSQREQDKFDVGYEKSIANMERIREKFLQGFLKDPSRLKIPTTRVDEATGKTISIGSKERKALIEEMADQQAFQLALRQMPRAYREKFLQETGEGFAPSAGEDLQAPVQSQVTKQSAPTEDDGFGFAEGAAGVAGLLLTYFGGKKALKSGVAQKLLGKGAKTGAAKKELLGLPAPEPKGFSMNGGSSSPKPDAAMLRAGNMNRDFDAEVMARTRGLPAPAEPPALLPGGEAGFRMGRSSGSLNDLTADDIREALRSKRMGPQGSSLPGRGDQIRLEDMRGNFDLGDLIDGGKPNSTRVADWKVGQLNRSGPARIEDMRGDFQMIGDLIDNAAPNWSRKTEFRTDQINRLQNILALPDISEKKKAFYQFMEQLKQQSQSYRPQ